MTYVPAGMPGPMRPPPRPFRPIGSETALVKVIFGIWIAITVLLVPAQTWLVAGHTDLISEPTSEAAALRLEDIVALYSLLTFPMLAITLASVAAYLAWLSRARDNAEALLPWHRHRHSKSWLVLAWIVPVVSLWYPYQIVRDIWTAGLPDAQRSGTDNKPRRPLLALWWVCYVVWSWLWPVPLQVMLEATEDTGISRSAWEGPVVLISGLIIAPVGIVAAVLGIRVVREISAAQTRAALGRSGRPEGAT